MALRYNHDDENAGENSFLKGRSVHNQRIESYWRQFIQHLGYFYMNLFKKMEEDLLIDFSNPVHIEFLRYCFGGLIKSEIRTTKKEWNEHSIRAQNNVVICGKPNEIFYCPNRFGGVDKKKPVNLDHVDYLIKNYTVEPSLYGSETEELIRLFTNAGVPTNPEDAYNLYVFLIDQFNAQN